GSCAGHGDDSRPRASAATRTIQSIRLTTFGRCSGLIRKACLQEATKLPIAKSGEPMVQLLIGGVLALLAMVSDQAHRPAAALFFAALMILWCALEARLSR